MNNFPVYPINPNGRYSAGIAGFQRVIGPRGETIFCFSPIWQKEDFIGAAYGLTALPYAAQEGTDTGTAAQAISAGILGGVMRLTSGDADGTYAADGSQITSGLNYRADKGGLLVEARIRMNTAVTGGSMGFGLTDTVALEEPFSISGTTQTSNASNAAMFTFDTAQTADNWYLSGVNANTDTAASNSGVAPVADTWDILRIEADCAGNTQWFINDILKGSVDAAFAPATLLTPIVYVCATTTTPVVVDIDYIAIAACR